MTSRMLLKGKRNGDIQGRACTDSINQPDNINKEDAASPTVSTELMFMTVEVDSRGSQDVATLTYQGHIYTYKWTRT